MISLSHISRSSHASQHRAVWPHARERARPRAPRRPPSSAGARVVPASGAPSERALGLKFQQPKRSVSGLRQKGGRRKRSVRVEGGSPPLPRGSRGPRGDRGLRAGRGAQRGPPCASGTRRRWMRFPGSFGNLSRKAALGGPLLPFAERWAPVAWPAGGARTRVTFTPRSRDSRELCWRGCGGHAPRILPQAPTAPSVLVNASPPPGP